MTDHAAPDHLTRFLLDQAGVRGVHVRLDETWARIRERAAPPAPVAGLLGQALAASALFTGHAKIDGRLSVQLRGSGALRTVFAECTGGGTLRGIATVRDGASLDGYDSPVAALGPDAVVAITIENPGLRGQEPARYQGLIALETDALSTAFEHYFQQSEQLPTRLLLAAGTDGVAGLMLQKLPGDAGDTDGWDRAMALFETLSPGELRSTPAQTLMHRLFHEDGVRLLGGKPLRFGCSCSRERVSAMLQSLGEAEAVAAADANAGVAQVRCEFCGESYRFDGPQIAALFAPGPATLDPPDRLQ